MSTSFNFPANPTLNQIVVLPDGNSAQWNGYAWVSVANNVTYPLEVPKGGTGATNPDTALTNLGGGATGVPIFKSATAAAARQILGLDGTIPWLLQDGTVAAPGLAWNSEPGFGFLRTAPGVMRIAVGGANVFRFYTGAGTAELNINPAAAGVGAVSVSNGPLTGNVNNLDIRVSSTGHLIAESLFGAATAKPLTLNFPAGVEVAPSTSNASVRLNKTSAAFENSLVGQVGGATRWKVVLGTGDAASDFAIVRYNDAGASVGTAFFISRATGDVSTPNWLRVEDSRANGAVLVLNHVGAAARYIRSLNGNIDIGNNAFAIVNTFDNAGQVYKPGGGAWAVISDARTKEQESIKPYTRGLEDILAYQPVSYRYREETGFGDRTYVGRIAGDLKVVDPDMVASAPMKVMDLDDVEAIDASNDIYKLINAIKTLHQRLTAIGA